MKKAKKLKEYSIMRNGTEHGTVKAESKKDAREQLFAAFGDNRCYIL